MFVIWQVRANQNSQSFFIPELEAAFHPSSQFDSLISYTNEKLNSCLVFCHHNSQGFSHHYFKKHCVWIDLIQLNVHLYPSKQTNKKDNPFSNVEKLNPGKRVNMV